MNKLILIVLCFVVSCVNTEIEKEPEKTLYGACIIERTTAFYTDNDCINYDGQLNNSDSCTYGTKDACTYYLPVCEIITSGSMKKYRFQTFFENQKCD